MILRSLLSLALIATHLHAQSNRRGKHHCLLFCTIFLILCSLNSFLLVTVPPLIEYGPEQEMAFREGESLQMTCVATGEPTPAYRWQMNEEDFDPSGTDGRIATQPGVGTLIFANPLERDEALYQCFAENEVGTALTVKVNLRQACVSILST